MSEIPQEMLYDVRLIERYVRRGVLSREAVDKYLSGVKDMADSAEAIAFDPNAVERRSGATAKGNSGGESRG